MLSDITFGQYFPTGSLIHRLDARIKLILCVALIVMIFLANNALSIFVAAAATLSLVFVSKISLKMYLKGLKAVLVIILFTAVLNAIYVKDGVVLFTVWKITVTTGGTLTAVYMAARIVMLLIISAMLTYTTSPTRLTEGIERLFSPLNYIKIDIHSLAMMMTIALRFIPTLIEETDKIMSAQKARGADMESGGIGKRIKALLPTIIPLLISSFRRASELADAMECRCYHGGKGRTKMEQTKICTRDIFALTVSAALIAAVVVTDVKFDGVLWRLLIK